MMNRLEVKNLGLAFGVAFVVFYLACIVMMAILGQETTVFVFNSLMHGLNTTTIIRMDVPIWDSIIGIILTFVLGWVMGALIAVTYNLFSTKKG